MAEKTARAARLWNEEQLDFPFLSVPYPAAEVGTGPPPASFVHLPRTAGRARGLTSALTNAQSALLAAPIEEVSSQLLPLLEFCEAVLTRALDTMTLRDGTEQLFSPEEYRSIRGIGQAQWLLAERYIGEKLEPQEKKPRKRKTSHSEKREKSQF